MKFKREFENYGLYKLHNPEIVTDFLQQNYKQLI